MTGSVLHLGGIDLPVDAVTGTFAVLATRGAGKSNTAVVMAEEMYDAGVAWVAVDPKGDWHGIRSSADGKGPGLPVIVFGGRHGDVPLEPTAGAVIADLVLQQRISCVLDVSQFTKADTIRFLLAFGQHLFAHADDADVEPLHLFLEEAHEYLPQQVSSKVDGGDIGRLVNVWQRIVKQGRFKGLGATMISQRSSVLNKDVLELIDTLIVLRTMGPRSRQSIAEWVRGQDVDESLLSSLPSLGDGEAWVWSPGELKISERIRFRRRRTFDSGATPKVGEKRRQPTTIADVDLAAIKEAMAETIERAKADDPKELRRRLKAQDGRIEDLERELARRPVVEPDPVIVEVPRLPEGSLVALDNLQALADQLQGGLTEFRRGARKFDEAPASPDRPGGATAPTGPASRRTPPAPVAAPPTAAREPRPTRAPSTGDTALTGPQRKLLTVLAVYGPRTKRQLAMQAGYSSKGGGFNNPLSALRSGGLITRGEPITATPQGLAELGDYDPLPTGQALIDHWFNTLSGPERKILQPLIDAWPGTMPKEDLAAAAGYDPSGGGFNNPLSRLRSLELVRRGTDIGLTEDFGEAIS